MKIKLSDGDNLIVEVANRNIKLSLSQNENGGVFYIHVLGGKDMEGRGGTIFEVPLEDGTDGDFMEPPPA